MTVLKSDIDDGEGSSYVRTLGLVNTEDMIHIQDVRDCSIWSVTIQLNWLQFGPIIWDKTSIEGEIPNTINVSLIFSSNFLSDAVGERKGNVIWGLMRSIKSTMAVSSLKFSQPEMSLFRLLVVNSVSEFWESFSVELITN